MERKKIYIDDRYFSSGENILWPLLAHLSYFASNQMCLCVIFIQKNQKWFYYNVEWTAHQSQWGKIYVYRSISLIFTTNWPGIRNIYTNTCTQRKMNQKKMMMMKKKKPKGKWFWVIWCRNELFALALLTSNWYALESFHSTFELNCDSFRNHFIIHTYIPVYLPLISVASVCWLLFFASAWYRFVLSCSAFIFIHSHVATNLRWAYFLSVFGPLLFWFYPATHPMTLTYVLCVWMWICYSHN